MTMDGYHFYMIASPKFFDGSDQAARVAVIKHELGHLIHCHLARFKKDRHDQQIWNCAIDCVVNKNVDTKAIDAGMQSVFGPDSHCVTIESMNKDIGTSLQPNCMAESYYDEIFKKIPKITIGNAQGQGTGKEEADPSGVSGHGVDEHMFNGPDGAGNDIDEEIAGEMVRQIVENAVEQAKACGAGTVPGWVTEMLNQKNKAKANWKAHLRKYFQSTIPRERQTTLKRPNKRIPVIPWSRRKIRVPDDAWVFIDTSGSISDSDIEMFTAHMNKICIDLKLRMKVACFDAQVYDPQNYRPGMTFNVVGRGGTAFAPVFEFCNRNNIHKCLIFTDGCNCEGSGYKIGDVRPFWAFTPNSNVEHVGLRIQLPDDWTGQLKQIKKGA